MFDAAGLAPQKTIRSDSAISAAGVPHRAPVPADQPLRKIVVQMVPPMAE